MEKRQQLKLIQADWLLNSFLLCHSCENRNPLKRTWMNPKAKNIHLNAKLKILKMKKIILLFFIISFSYNVFSQIENDSELYKTIVRLDKELFDAYNSCTKDLDKHASFYSEDIEFFHDKSGLATTKEEIIESIKKNICGKVKRELVSNSLEMYKIPNYGVVVIGFHKFHNLIEKSVSPPSKFIVFWKQNENDWKLTKVVSLH